MDNDTDTGNGNDHDHDPGSSNNDKDIDNGNGNGNSIHGDGKIDHEEFFNAMRSTFPNMSKRDINSLFSE
eukprot:Pgem_evm1s6984